jgi:hypothetical protein
VRRAPALTKRDMKQGATRAVYNHETLSHIAAAVDAGERRGSHDPIDGGQAGARPTPSGLHQKGREGSRGRGRAGDRQDLTWIERLYRSGQLMNAADGV